MQLLPVFCVLFLCGVGYAEDESFDDAIKNYLASCKKAMEEKGNLMMAYVYTNPHTFGRIPSFDVASFEADFDPMSEKSRSEVLLKTACVCTKIPMNTFDYIVVPFMFNGTIRDALTMCLFHDDYTEYDYVLNFPDHLLSNWMYAQYIAQMPKTLIAPASQSADCIDLNGNPTAAIPNQKACYYVNYAAFNETDGKIETVVKNAYSGPFLGSQYPDFKTLQQLAGLKTSTLDFMTQFDYVLCALVKNNTRLNPDVYKTGCRHKIFNNVHKVVIYGCCCVGQDDPNCSAVTEAVKNNKTLCLDGELSGGASGFYFASQCPFKAVKKYKRIMPIGITEDTNAFEHLQALSILSQPTIEFKRSSDCHVSYATECSAVSVDVVHKGCCNGNDFCNLKDAMTSNIKRCRWSYGEKQETSGCAVVFYWTNNQWVRSSIVWFEMEKSKLVYLYSSQTSDVAYNVSLGFLINKNVEESCPEQTHRYQRQYYVISCATPACDYDFDELFFNYLHESIVKNAIDQAAVPRCETGSMTFTTDNVRVDELPYLANTTRDIGIYCTLDLRIRVVRNKKVIDVLFRPVFPLPDNCDTDEGNDDDFKLTCCFEASSNRTHIQPRCHYSNIMSVVNELTSRRDSGDEDLVTVDPAEPTKSNIRQGVYEHDDLCEQSHIGHVGKVSRRCQPGGYGCFHMNGLNDTHDAVIASCIGRAEKYVAKRDDAFERYHEALICLMEEAQGKCHLVVSGKRRKYLCCCKATEVRNDIARCNVDSNLLFNTHNFEVRYVSDFKDDY